MAGYTRQSASNIVDDGVINASDFNDEYNAIETAFNASTGHVHDGTAANGARILEIGPSGDFTVSGTSVLPLTTNTLDIGSASVQFKDMYLDGTLYADGLGEDILIATDKKAQFRDTAIYLNSSADGQLDIVADTEVQIATTTLDINANTDVSGTLAVGGTGAITGNTTVGGTLGVTGAVTANAGVVVDNITIDGTEIDLSSGDLTIDVAGDIVLDADGGDILVKDAGTQYAALTNSSGNLILKSGSTTAATFSGANVDLAGTLDVTGAGTLDSTLDVAGATTLSTTLDVTGNSTIGGTLGVTGNTTLTANLVVNGNTTLGNANTDTVTVTADVASNLIPSADSTYALGDSSNYWSAGYIDTVTTTSHVNVGGNATITGNLTVNGTTFTVDSTVTTLQDPILTLGGNSAPASDDNKDRGLEFRWHNGSTAKVGFFGFDDSTGRFTFIPDATNTNEVFSGTKGTIDIAGIVLNGTEITATAAEINKLDGVTATTAELNLMDGVTATTAELNYVDGVTSNIQTQLNAKQATLTTGDISTTLIADDAVTADKIADDAVGTAAIAANAVTATEIAANAVGASELNISGNGTSGQVVQSDGDGSFSYATLASAFLSGMIMPYAGSSAPSGWLLSYGQAISRSTYSDLFSAIGTTYGAGDGSTTFNVPDLRGRTIAGQDDMGGSSSNRLTSPINGDTLGATGGSESHTLTEAELPSHTHSSGGTISITRGSGSTETGVFGLVEIISSGSNTFSVSGTSGSAGSGSAHNNVQPTLILNYIIKT